MDEPVFEYDSGAQEIHPAGAWTLRLYADGALRIGHRALGRETEFGPFALNAAELEALWRYIRGLDIARPPADTRNPGPDEYCSEFTLRSSGAVQSMSVWAHVAARYPPIGAFTAAVRMLIAHYTGENPALD